mmetsp:Transcript_174913/g.560859  ORF Transcript_174913/g.560859 Transcript_174913/m.560859 type:complete len:248 (+) Transcript_174913:366-1109(+)
MPAVTTSPSWATAPPGAAAASPARTEAPRAPPVHVLPSRPTLLSLLVRWRRRVVHLRKAAGSAAANPSGRSAATLLIDFRHCHRYRGRARAQLRWPLRRRTPRLPNDGDKLPRCCDGRRHPSSETPRCQRRQAFGPPTRRAVRKAMAATSSGTLLQTCTGSTRISLRADTKSSIAARLASHQRSHTRGGPALHRGQRPPRGPNRKPAQTQTRPAVASPSQASLAWRREAYLSKPGPGRGIFGRRLRT